MLNMCTVCLSKGRILNNIDHYRDIYEAIVSPQYQVHEMALCFECMSVLKRCRRFQKNATAAQEKLKLLCSDPPDSLLHTNLQTYSRLGLSNIKSVGVSPNSDRNFDIITSRVTHCLHQSKDLKTDSEAHRDPLSEPFHEPLDIKVAMNTSETAKTELNQIKATEEQLVSPKKSVKIIRLPPEMCKKLKLIPASKLPSNIKVPSDLLKKVVLVPKTEKTDEKPTGNIRANTTAVAKPNTRLTKKGRAVITPKKFSEIAEKLKKVKPKKPVVSPVKCDSSGDDEQDVPQCSEQEIKKKFTKMLQKSGLDEDALSMVKIHVMSDEDLAASRDRLRSEEQFQNSEYKCDQCILGYYTEQQLHDHTKAKHVQRDPMSIECGVCSAYIPHAQYLFHYGRHKVLYECRACAQHYSEPRQLTRHLARHAAGAGYQCGHCRRTFAVEVNLRRHITQRICRSIADKKYICDVCQKGFRFKYNLRKHVLIHTETRTEHCVLCDKWYKTAETLAAHVKYVHERDASLVFRCAECDLTFASRLSYDFHMTKTKRHAEASTFRNICEVCGKAFVKLRELENHMNYRHRGYTEFVCPHCSKMYSSASGLKKHLKFVHEGHKHEKNRECPVCGKRFTNSKTAKEHVNIHTGSRPFKCLVCGDTFKQSSALYTHNRLVHLGYKARGKTRREKTAGEAAPSARKDQ